MNTKHFTTFGTNPFRLFIPNEVSDPKFINYFEIVDHTHSIFCSVTLIQLFQPGTWKFITAIGTILCFTLGDFFTVSDFTSGTTF